MSQSHRVVTTTAAIGPLRALRIRLSQKRGVRRIRFAHSVGKYTPRRIRPASTYE
jgi:hypothetical protein